MGRQPAEAGTAAAEAAAEATAAAAAGVKGWEAATVVAAVRAGAEEAHRSSN